MKIVIMLLIWCIAVAIATWIAVVIHADAAQKFVLGGAFGLCSLYFGEKIADVVIARRDQ